MEVAEDKHLRANVIDVERMDTKHTSVQKNIIVMIIIIIIIIIIITMEGPELLKVKLK
jgi:hypothetical protein